MKALVTIIIFIIGISIAEYSLVDKTINLKARIIVLNNFSVPYKEPIGRTLTRLGIGLENPKQEFKVVVGYIVNKEKVFESWTIPSKILQNNIDEEELPIVISILYFRFLPNDFISCVKIDENIIKINSFFNSNYRKFIKE